MTGGMSQREFQDYLGLLGRLLRLRTAQRTAIEDELRAHMEERFAALTSQGIEPEQAVSMALAEFGDAAALAAEFTAISRLQKRRWMMRFTIGSIAATVVLAAVVVSIWPGGSGELTETTAYAQQPEKPAPPKAEKPAEKPAEKQDANAQTQAKLEKHIDADFQPTPAIEGVIIPQETRLDEVLDYLAKAAEVQMYVDRRALDEKKIDPASAPVTINLKDIPAEMALRLVLRQHGLAHMLDHGVVIVTTPDEMARSLEIQVYSISDLVQPPSRPAPAEAGPAGLPGAFGYEGPGGYRHAEMAPQSRVTALIDLITSTVDPESWNEVGGPANICEYRGALVIAQTYQGHRKVERLLKGLREALAKQPAPSAPPKPPAPPVGPGGAELPPGPRPDIGPGPR